MGGLGLDGGEGRGWVEVRGGSGWAEAGWR